MVDQWPLLTLLPPLVTIALAIITRRVLLSLGLGVLVAAVLVADLSPGGALVHVWSAASGIFWAEGGLNTDYVFILLFLVLLGVITALVMMAGGSEAFSRWASQRIRTRRGSKFLAAVLGVALFIDDYFNALAVGQIAKPVTDRFRVSRAKLAYIVDSTSAPVTVLAPFSSWGASIIGLMSPILLTAGVAANDVLGFLGAAAANYYAIAAVVGVFLVIWFGFDFGPMRREERRALVENEMFDQDATIPGELTGDLPVHRPGAIRALAAPFLTLVVGVIAAMFITGYFAGGSAAPMDMIGNTVVADSLLFGALAGCAVALYYYLRHTRGNDEFHPAILGRGILSGAGSMTIAIAILVLAWMLGTLIGELGTGEFLGEVVTSAGIGSHWLIPIMFVVAAAMAFSTGTSWGSFGILIPLAGDILLGIEAHDLLLPAMGAVLAGAVMGDHTSPISDTTILSSTGAGCEIVTHVATQLPYALIAGAGALVGYVVLAATAQVWLGLVVTLVLSAGCLLWGAKRMVSLEETYPLPEHRVPETA